MTGNTQTIIWDLDGTLLDSFGISVEILRQILPRHGYAIPRTQEMATKSVWVMDGRNICAL